MYQSRCWSTCRTILCLSWGRWAPPTHCLMIVEKSAGGCASLLCLTMKSATDPNSWTEDGPAQTLRSLRCRNGQVTLNQCCSSEILRWDEKANVFATAVAPSMSSWLCPVLRFPNVALSRIPSLTKLLRKNSVIEFSSREVLSLCTWRCILFKSTPNYIASFSPLKLQETLPSQANILDDRGLTPSSQHQSRAPNILGRWKVERSLAWQSDVLGYINLHCKYTIHWVSGYNISLLWPTVLRYPVTPTDIFTVLGIIFLGPNLTSSVGVRVDVYGAWKSFQ